MPEDVSSTSDDIRLHQPTTAHRIAVRDPMHKRFRAIKEDRLLLTRVHVACERIGLHHAPSALLIRRDLGMTRGAKKAQIAHGIVPSEVDRDYVVNLPSWVATEHAHSIALVNQLPRG